jgi:hypothetical protein
VEGDQEVWYGIYFFDLQVSSSHVHSLVELAYELLSSMQNPSEVLHGERPKLVEKGPYMYREYYYRFDVQWLDGGEKVLQFRTLYTFCMQ